MIDEPVAWCSPWGHDIHLTLQFMPAWDRGARVTCLWCTVDRRRDEA